MSGLSGFAKVVALVATVAFGAMAGSDSASAQFGKREGGGGGRAAAGAPAGGGGGGGAAFRGGGGGGGGAAFRGGGGGGGGAAFRGGGGGGSRSFVGGGNAFGGGGVARSFNGGNRSFVGGGRRFGNGAATVNRFSGAPAFRGGFVNRQPAVRFRSGDRDTGFRNRRRGFGYGYVAPYPVYSPYYYGGYYRTCVIRKRWVHTRFGWRKLPRRVCFRRY